jgi:aspartate carbamoyltransferase catalytic subunit
MAAGAMTVSQTDERGHLRHLISLADLPRTQIERVIDRASTYLTPVGKLPPRDVTLEGRTVANLFFEPSTRTRASFELAAKRLSADVLNLDVNMSSRAKGESLLDTIYTLQAMQVDIFVVRDASTGVPARIADHVAPHVCVLNAGESDVSHPTQGLLDVMTIQRHKGDVGKLCVAIIGDIRHSRVARSATEALTKLGVGELRLIGPPELLPEQGFAPAESYTDLGKGLANADVVMALRIQKERFAELDEIPDPQEYYRRFGLSERRLKQAKADVIVMHPGPMNRGIEIDGSVADGPRSVIQEQVTNGLAIRMAVLALVHEHIVAETGSV